MNSKIIKGIKDPYYGCELILHQMARYISDEKYVSWKYYLNFHKKLNLIEPQTYNEKLQWLKLYDQHEEYTRMVDKYEAKNYVASIIGDEYIIPTIGVYNSFDEIDFDKLPDQFVMKCTHNSGGIFICKDKATFDIDSTRKQMKKWLRKNPYWKNREYPYRNVKPRIIVEKYMVDESGVELKDYKIMCFNGDPRCLFALTGRYKHDIRLNFYDLHWNKLPFERGYPNTSSPTEIQQPKGFSKMIELSKVLSRGIPHVRVDFYDICGKVYFGELTFFPGSGLEVFKPNEWDNILGSWLVLPNK